MRRIPQSLFSVDTYPLGQLYELKISALRESPHVSYPTLSPHLFAGATEYHSDFISPFHWQCFVVLGPYGYRALFWHLLSPIYCIPPSSPPSSSLTHFSPAPAICEFNPPPFPVPSQYNRPGRRHTPGRPPAAALDDPLRATEHRPAIMLCTPTAKRSIFVVPMRPIHTLTSLSFPMTRTRMPRLSNTIES